jgi:hypothetical protein
MDVENNGYYLPDSCIEGETYYVRDDYTAMVNSYQPVIFLSYRPHPGEVLIKENGEIRVMQRRYLLTLKQEKTGSDSQTGVDLD